MLLILDIYIRPSVTERNNDVQMVIVNRGVECRDASRASCCIHVDAIGDQRNDAAKITVVRCTHQGTRSRLHSTCASVQ